MVSGWAFRRVFGQVGSGKSLSGLYLRNRKVWEVDTWLGHLLGGVGVQCHGLILKIFLNFLKMAWLF